MYVVSVYTLQTSVVIITLLKYSYVVLRLQSYYFNQHIRISSIMIIKELYATAVYFQIMYNLNFIPSIATWLQEKFQTNGSEILVIIGALE